MRALYILLLLQVGINKYSNITPSKRLGSTNSISTTTHFPFLSWRTSIMEADHYFFGMHTDSLSCGCSHRRFFAISSRSGKSDNTLKILNNALEREHFDLAVITGDLVNGYAFFKSNSIRQAYHEVSLQEKKSIENSNSSFSLSFSYRLCSHSLTQKFRSRWR